MSSPDKAHYRHWLTWRVDRWRARRALYYAELEYRRQQTPGTIARRIRARQHLDHVELMRP